ncbi:hypothetical protein JTB14_024816 [Gonioctena quinquepunctata]|nr:hypothetical protein JTB14_024816 [Gonioctena quinquepunctata]
MFWHLNPEEIIFNDGSLGPDGILPAFYQEFQPISGAYRYSDQFYFRIGHDVNFFHRVDLAASGLLGLFRPSGLCSTSTLSCYSAGGHIWRLDYCSLRTHLVCGFLTCAVSIIGPTSS